jgi:hypothetical protein
MAYYIQEKDMNSQITTLQKPSLVNVIAWMTLASGIVNLFWGIGLALTVMVTIIGIVCVPFAILPTVLGVFEIIYAAKLLSNPPQPVQPSTNIAILEIVCILAGNIFSVVVGILALVFYNDLTVRDYFTRLNGSVPPEAPVAPVAPLVPVEPVLAPEPPPAPITPEELRPVEEPPLRDDEMPKA